MKGKGLSKELIYSAALELVNEKGYGNFSMRDLADHLGVRAASLYKHISGVDDINKEIGIMAAAEMNSSLRKATEGKERDDALRAVGIAYRDFADQQPELYNAILGMPRVLEDAEQLNAIKQGFRPINEVVDNWYHISYEDRVHFSRCYRSALHGFIALHKAGYYTNNSAAVEESFGRLLEGFVRWLNEMEPNQKTAAG